MARRQIGVTIESMTGSPHGVTPGGSWPPPSGPPPTWPPTPPKQSRALVIVSLLIAIVAVAVATGSWFRPTSEDNPPPVDLTPKYSDQEIEASTAAMCDAYQKARKAISEAGRQSSDDPNVQFTIAVNARLAIQANISFLRQAVADKPALPADIAQVFNNMASAYEDILMAQLAGAPANSFGEMNATLDGTDADAVEACK